MTEAVAPAGSASTASTRLRVFRNPLTLGCLGFVALLTLAAVFAPLLAPHDPLEQDLGRTLLGPGADHWLGTDQLGRDVLSRLLYGARVSLVAATEAVAVALLVGVPAGIVAGYYGRWADAVLDRFSDVVLAMPSIIVLLTVLAVFGPNITAAMVTLGILFAPTFMRLARASTLAVRGELYVDAAQVAGLPHPRIITRHILPNVLGPVIIRASMVFGIALLTESGLSYLGLGVRPPTPNWGAMVSEAGKVVDIQPWLLIPTGGVITLTVLAFTLIGDSLHDAATATATAAPPKPPPPRVTARDRDGASNGAAPAAGPPPGTLLSVQGLDISFPAAGGWQRVVAGASFTVGEREAVGLVGESACGKTVTALAIMGLVPRPGRVTGGSIVFDGQELAGLPEKEFERVRGSQIGFVAQEPMVSLDPVFTVGELIAEPLRHHLKLTRSQARARTLELLELVGMTDPRETASSFPHQVSGGMAQRVAIAMALGARPRLLIADEPTTALDVTIQAEILDLFRTLQKELSMAVVLVTHDLGVLADFCTSAVVMYAGQVVETAPVTELLDRPLMPYTDGLLRSDPHRATVDGKLPAIPGTVPAPGEWPAGCHFASRCPLATDGCSAAPVALAEPLPGRTSRCIRVDELLARSPT